MIMLTVSLQSSKYITVDPINVLDGIVIIPLTLVYYINHVNPKKYNFSSLQDMKCFLCLSLQQLLKSAMNKLETLL